MTLKYLVRPGTHKVVSHTSSSHNDSDPDMSDDDTTTPRQGEEQRIQAIFHTSSGKGARWQDTTQNMMKKQGTTTTKNTAACTMDCRENHIATTAKKEDGTDSTAM